MGHKLKPKATDLYIAYILYIRHSVVASLLRQRTQGEQKTQTNEVQGNKATAGWEGHGVDWSVRAVLCVQNPGQSHLLSALDRQLAGRIWVWQTAREKFMNSPLTQVTLEPRSSGN